MSYELLMFKEYVAQLEKQFPQYSDTEKVKILESVRSLVVEPKIIAKARSQQEVLADIRVQIEEDGRAGLFFATAFANWYRRAENPRVAHLYDYVNLDLKNRFLFMEMMSLRDSGHFDDEALFQFEQYCLEKTS